MRWLQVHTEVCKPGISTSGTYKPEVSTSGAYTPGVHTCGIPSHGTRSGKWAQHESTRGKGHDKLSWATLPAQFGKFTREPQQVSAHAQSAGGKDGAWEELERPGSCWLPGCPRVGLRCRAPSRLPPALGPPRPAHQSSPTAVSPVPAPASSPAPARARPAAPSGSAASRPPFREAPRLRSRARALQRAAARGRSSRTFPRFGSTQVRKALV